MARLTEADVAALLRDPQCPVGVSINDRGSRPILVAELERLARERLPEVEACSPGSTRWSAGWAGSASPR